MSQKELLEAISQQASLQTEKVLAEAGERAAVIVRRAESELGKIKQGILDQARASMVNEEAKIINDARLKAKKDFLMAKHELITRAMKGLEQKLAELPKRKDYPAILHLLLKESLEGVQGRVTVRCRAQDRKIVEDYLAQSGLKATIEEKSFRLGGVDVLYGDNLQFIRRNTFESRLEKIYPELLREAHRLILGGQEPQ